MMKNQFPPVERSTPPSTCHLRAVARVTPRARPADAPLASSDRPSARRAMRVAAGLPALRVAPRAARGASDARDARRHLGGHLIPPRGGRRRDARVAGRPRRPRASPRPSPPVSRDSSATRPASPGAAASGGGDLLVEVSTGGAEQRRWARSASGGFDRLPPARDSGSDASPSSSGSDASPSPSSSGSAASPSFTLAALDPRASPRLRAIFLPAGYPASVSPDYAPFIRWHLGSLVFRNVLEVLTAQSLLVALGMGSTPGALPLTAATKWVLKDGVGSFATLAAGALGGQRYDEDPKRWWALSNLLEDAARALELITPAFPGAFLPLAASATFVRSAALTARGSLMNGTFMQHLGRNENLGDVRAKLEVQGRWLALVALPAGVAIFRAVGGAFAPEAAAAGIMIVDPAALPASASARLVADVARYGSAFAAYGLVVFGHAACCWKAADCLRFESLNRARLSRLARAYVRGERPLPDVDAAGASEGVYRRRNPPGTPILGASVTQAASDWRDLDRVLARSAEGATTTGAGGAVAFFALGWDAETRAVSALLDAEATPRDVIEAALACAKAASLIEEEREERGGGNGLRDETASKALEYARGEASRFVAEVEAGGWRTDFVQMGAAPRYRISGGSGAGEGEGGEKRAKVDEPGKVKARSV